MKLREYFARRRVEDLVRLACLLGLAALTMMCVAIVFPRPLPVVLAMSVGHVMGGAALASYLLAVVLDALSREPPDSSTGTESPRRVTSNVSK